MFLLPLFFALVSLLSSLVAAKPISVAERLAVFDALSPRLEQAVTIRWNSHMVPYVQAGTDRDLAYTMGLVQGHLRGSAIVLYRLGAQGRVSETAGYLANDVDRFLRVIDPYHAADAIIERMPEATRQWLFAYVEGLNDYMAQVYTKAPPEEWGLANLKLVSDFARSAQLLRASGYVLPVAGEGGDPNSSQAADRLSKRLGNRGFLETTGGVEPFTPADIIAIGRVSGIDVNWFGIMGILAMGNERIRVQEEIRKIEGAEPGASAADSRLRPAPLVDGEQEQSANEATADRIAELKEPLRSLYRQLADIDKEWHRLVSTSDGFLNLDGSIFGTLQGASRNGSNAWVIDPSRARNGAVMLANDPHLGYANPNIWFIMGVESPSYRAVGMVPTGIPLVALGRSEHMAWGGTNMRNAISDFYDVSALSDDLIESKTSTIRTRLWRNVPFTVRRTSQGGILTDVPFVAKRVGNPSRTLAVRWTGNEFSDEITAMLDLMRAETVQEGRQALKEFGTPSQNMVLGDTQGNIALVYATKQPIRQGFPRRTVVLDPTNPEHQWAGLADAASLPAIINPASGYIGSANNKPRVEGVKFGYAFSPEDRIERINHLLDARFDHDVQSFREMQLDTYSVNADGFAHALLVMIGNAPSAEGADLLRYVQQWDGHYTVASKGATAFENLFNAVVLEIYPDRRNRRNWNYVAAYMIDDLRAMPDDARQKLLYAALRKATKLPIVPWGEVHTLRIQHVLGAIPVLGSRYRLQTIPLAGSRQTLNKSDHGIGDTGNDAYRTSYGSQSRFITDLSHPDENYLLLMGGNDGWFGSEAFADQVNRFTQGDHLRIPLRWATVVDNFPMEHILLPQTPTSTGGQATQ
ncbi:MAG: penicillin acylase family protein [Alphaproteobacteria bacterium]|nr:penicillin acylase family protein [Alphaproteobacteria bacterium]